MLFSFFECIWERTGMWVLNENITIYLEMNSVLEGGNQMMLQGLRLAIEAPSTN